MKSILIIGLGRFGTHLIHRFYDLGDEVMAVDISEEKVQEAMPFVTSSQNRRLYKARYSKDAWNKEF